MRRILAVTALSCTSLVAALGASGGDAATIDPSSGASSFTATVSTWSQTPTTVDNVSWRAPEDYLSIATKKADRTDIVSSEGSTLYTSYPGKDTYGTVNEFAAHPDSYSDMDTTAMIATASVLGRARAGGLKLKQVTLGGVAAYRTTYRLSSVDCAGVPAGVATIWIDRATLLPLRLDERRGRKHRLSFRQIYRYTALNPVLADSLFTVPAVKKPESLGFHRAQLADIPAHLGYNPQVPSYLPTGFALAVSGWAAKGSVVGPEAYIPASKGLFQAVYRRGGEKIDLTIRRASKPATAGWRQSDPFGGECESIRTATAHIGSVTGTFGVSELNPPHLWWKRGSLLYTLQGPFPQAELEKIAESLTPALAE